MANSEHVKIFKQGAKVWNEWRAANPTVRPDLSDANFESDLHTYKSTYDCPEFTGYDLSRSNLNRIVARNSSFTNCFIAGSDINFSDLCFSSFNDCIFNEASIAVSKIGSASFNKCDFENANLSYCTAEETSFWGSRLISTNLSHMSLVKTDLSNTVIDGSCVYGISAWDLILDGSRQQNIYISDNDRSITVPSIELAQFISLLVNNSKIRDVIDSITSKVVLILGCFSEDRKIILDQIKHELQRRDYLPVLFDFDGPKNRDITETVMTLASLAKFVVADISDPRSIPQELTKIVPNFPSVPVQPVIVSTQREYGMFSHFSRFPWVLETLEYSGDDIHNLVGHIVDNCESRLKTTNTSDHVGY